MIAVFIQWCLAIMVSCAALASGDNQLWFAAGWGWALVFALHHERWLDRKRNA